MKRLGIVCGALIAVVTLASMIGSYAWRQAAAPLVQKLTESARAEATARAAADSALSIRIAEMQRLQEAMLRALIGGRGSVRGELKKLRQGQESMLRIMLKPPSREAREKMLGQLSEPYRRRP